MTNTVVQSELSNATASLLLEHQVLHVLCDWGRFWLLILYALAVHFLIIACLRILKHTVIAIATHGNKSEMMSCVSEELMLKLHMGHGKNRETGGKGEEHPGYSDKFLQLLGLGRCGECPCSSSPDSSD